MIRAGRGEPVVLLHGVLSSERCWRHVVDHLSPHRDTVALTMLGHRGGTPVTRRPVVEDDLLDDVEQHLDALGLEAVHVAGNSLGGWVGVGLARRGRARSLTLFSPAGCWGPQERASAVALLARIVQATRKGRDLLDTNVNDPDFRRMGLSANAVHGDRVTPAEFLEIADDVIGCEMADDMTTFGEAMGSAHNLDVPITLVWSAQDRIFPIDVHLPIARSLLPQADVIVLDDVGHVPMFDDPALVGRIILERTAAG